MADNRQKEPKQNFSYFSFTNLTIKLPNCLQIAAEVEVRVEEARRRGESHTFGEGAEPTHTVYQPFWCEWGQLLHRCILRYCMNTIMQRTNSFSSSMSIILQLEQKPKQQCSRIWVGEVWGAQLLCTQHTELKLLNQKKKKKVCFFFCCCCL